MTLSSIRNGKSVLSWENDVEVSGDWAKSCVLIQFPHRKYTWTIS